MNAKKIKLLRKYCIIMHLDFKKSMSLYESSTNQEKRVYDKVFKSTVDKAKSYVKSVVDGLTAPD